ncbi:MAG: bifunctional demethylmenaquinone methyltransferase/2-methoxy-6-polyprenyl-1,4-benzoquinol methylase UbiE [Armatimonadetes bacterium]|nr:bifunctional demethylmenaquinone methyltransferase/2-methoxy-6-polyprenyl-1,4-benzoquinol methylase UbiE [Armatimonadota bacterium]
MKSAAPKPASLGYLTPGDDPDPTGFERAQQFYQPGEKPRFVQGVFDRIAGRYDLLNSVTSLGMHHLWRARTVSLANLRPGDTALDIACGTGDFLPGLRRRVGAHGRVIGLDFSHNMLLLAAQKLRRGRVEAHLIQGDAEHLPFEAESVQAVTIGFALRNLSDVGACLREIHRVLTPGGRLLALEIARPQWWPYRPLFLFYFERVLPRLAAMFGGEKKAYRWLPASLAAFYSRDGVTDLMKQAGFGDVQTHNFAGGAVCAYVGEKL